MSEESNLPKGHPIPWDQLVPYERQQGGYWLHFPRGNKVFVRELAGRDLACWCPLDQPCHADVLLEIANSKITAWDLLGIGGTP
ncbi:DUF4326 domain-containing protein [Streptomyces sp.]|uniref:DUF4326 domain-containing protein n=1 Tax=Streptomyces sp. TaxID=1931 RepID=UPI002F942187